MQTGMNPYRDWLGISQSEQPPHHYRLLGLPAFEADVAQIAAAAARWKLLLNAFLQTEHRAEAERVIGEIEAAAFCLQDRYLKSAYDDRLRAALAANAAVSLAPPAAAIVPAIMAAPPQMTEVTAPPSYAPAIAAVVEASPQAIMPGPPTMPVPEVAGLLTPASFTAPVATPVAAAVPQAVPTAIPVALPVAQPVATPSATPQLPVPEGQPAMDSVHMRLADLTSKLDRQPGNSASAEANRREQHASSTWMYAGVPAAAVVAIGLILMAVNASKARNNTPGGSSASIARAPTEQSTLDPRPNELANRPPKIDRERPKLPEAVESERPSTSAPNRQPTVPSQTPTANSTKPLEPNPAPTSTPSPTVPPVTPTPVPPTPTPATPNLPATSPPSPVPMPQPGSNKDAVVKALTAVRYHLSQRDIAVARKQLETAKAAAEASAHAEEIGRVEALLHYVNGFWEGVRECIQGLPAGNQVTIKEIVVGVVEVAPDRLILKMDGRNRTFFINSLPSGLAFGLAENWFNKADPASKIFLGAFHVVDPKGDRQKARELWQQASSAGKKVEVDTVWAELEVPLPTMIEAPSAVATSDPKPGADGRFPVPSVALQAKAQAEVQQMFEEDLLQAKDPESRKALAERMLARAGEKSDNKTMQYGLLTEAKELAIAAGEFDLLLSIVDKQAALFTMEALTAKTDALFEAAKSTETAEANAALAGAALILCDEAVLTEKFDQALRLARTAVACARKSKNDDLLKECLARDKEVRDLKK